MATTTTTTSTARLARVAKVVTSLRPQSHKVEISSKYFQPNKTSKYFPAAATVVEARVAAPVVGIRSQSFDAPNPEFRYSFETENDIKQEAEGTLRNVGGTDVVVMRGSYSYVGVDGNTWEVEWYADETGYHPSAPFLPQPVAPDHPEVAAAVEAQLRFAAEQEAAELAEAAASSRSETIAAPLAGYNGY